MADYDKIKNNPAASAAVLRRLAKSEPFLVLDHVNCPIDLWFDLAKRFPIEALQSPSAPLHLLADPSRWHQMEAKSCVGWMEWHLVRVSDRDQQSIAADYLEHALPIYELIGQNDAELREIIKIRRNMGEDTLGLHAGNELIMKMWNQRPVNALPNLAANMIRNTAFTFLVRPVTTVSHGIREAIAFVRQSEGAGVEEGIWQWRRLQQYLDGTVQPMGGQIGGIVRSAVVAGRNKKPGQSRT